MIRRLRWTLGFAGIVAAVAPGGLRAADHAPEALLKSHDLKRSGSTYVLAAETEVQRKIHELRLQSRQLNLVLQQQQALERGHQGRAGMIQEMLREHVRLGEQLKALDQQIAFGAPLNAQRNRVVIEYNGLGDHIRLLQNQQVGSTVHREVQTAASRRRGDYIEAVLQLRQVVDQTMKTYEELAQNDEVAKALEALGQAKVRFKLGPSRQFQDNVKLLERIEKTVITDQVELRRTHGGVYEVDVTFNGTVHRPMIFDTGAALTLIPAKLAAEIGLNVSPSDPDLRCATADGTVVMAKQKTIPSMRVGRFTINAIECAVLPPSKGDVEPLLGQSFHRHFTYKMTPGSGHLVMSQVHTLDPPQTNAGGLLPKNTTKGRRTTRSKVTAGRAKSTSGPDGD